MIKLKILIVFSVLLLVITFTPKTQAGNSCSYGNITTTNDIPHQMSYPDEQFIGIANVETLRDLSQLSGLTCLQYVDYYKSEVTGDLANLSKLKDLIVFNMNNNPGIYGDVCALSKAKNLRILRLAFNPYITGDISCLKSLNLEVFAMTGTQITGDLADLSHMTNLRELYLGGTNVEGDVASLANLTGFTELVISDNQEERQKIYGDLSTLKNLTNLKRVGLYNTNTTNCQKFIKDHPEILEGGCSELNKLSSDGLVYNVFEHRFVDIVLLSVGVASTVLFFVILLRKRR